MLGDEAIDAWGTTMYSPKESNPTLETSISLKPSLEALPSKRVPIPQKSFPLDKIDDGAKIRLLPRWNRIRQTVSTHDRKPKVITYTAHDLNMLGAIFSTKFSFLSTHYMISFVFGWTLIAVLFSLLVIYTKVGASLETTNLSRLQSNVQILISFVLAGYVGNSLSRWDRMVTTNLGGICNLLEHMLLSLQHQLVVMKQHDNPAVRSLFELLVRYLRLLMKLVFLSAQNDGDLSTLLKEDLLTAEEEVKLRVVDVDSRPSVLIVWLSGYFRGLKSIGLELNVEGFISQLITLRVNILDLIRLVRTPYPFSYVHLVHWIVQFMILFLAFETGAFVGTYYAQCEVGGGSEPDVFLASGSISTYVSNLLYCIFAEGLLSVVDKLHNPLSHHCSSVSESLIGNYGLLTFPNCYSIFISKLSILSDMSL